jgi:hypothetical protein
VYSNINCAFSKFKFNRKVLQQVDNKEAQSGKQLDQVKAADVTRDSGPVELRALGWEGHVVVHRE